MPEETHDPLPGLIGLRAPLRRLQEGWRRQQRQWQWRCQHALFQATGQQWGWLRPRDHPHYSLPVVTSHQQLIRTVRLGTPVLAAFMLPGCSQCQAFERVMRRAAASFEPTVHFVVVDCSSCPDLCKSRQISSLPHVELFWSPVEQQKREREEQMQRGVAADEVVHNVDVHPFDKVLTLYGVRVFLLDKKAISPLMALHASPYPPRDIPHFLPEPDSMD